jgi:hypothetical protein
VSGPDTTNHHIKFLRGLVNPDVTVGKGWFLEEFPIGICQLLSMPMLVIQSAGNIPAERTQYTILMHYTMRELQALVSILCWRHNQWVRSLYQNSEVACGVLDRSGFNLASLDEGAMIKDLDDVDIPSFDL